MPNIAPKAAGCVINADDFSRICISLSCYCAQLGCGSVTATLGLLIPFFASKFDVQCTDLAILLTLSGMGYFAGVQLVSKMLDPLDVIHTDLSRFTLLTCSACSAGASALSLLVAEELWMVKALIFAQFIGIGGIDVLSTVALSEMWGQRVQPWMQARSAFYSIGGMIPPMLAAASGVRAPLIACTVLCMSTAFGGSFDAAVSYLWSRDNSMDAGNPSVVAVPSAESTPLVQSEARSRARRRTRSDSYSGDGLTAPKGSMSSARNASEAPLESEELTVLGLIIDSHQLGSDKSGECTSVVENLVTTVLDATPYCNITDAERNDPAFEPNINKTLSFASSKIVHTITRTDAIGMSPAQVSFVDDLKDSVVLVPRKARLLLALMALLFYSCMTSFVGWLPSYFKLKVFPDHNDWTMMGSQMVSTFFFFMTIGCLASIPCSVYVSITKMIRFHLALVSSGGILLQLAVVVRPVPVTSLLLIGAGFMGYGISAIFPLVVTVSNDYGFTMDATATSGLLKGVAIGGIFVPLILGYLMRHVGPNILSLGLAVLSVGLSVTYAVIHMYLSTEAEAVIVRGRKRLRSASSGARSFSGQNSMSVHNEARVRLRSLSYNSAEYGSSDITV